MSYIFYYWEQVVLKTRRFQDNHSRYTFDAKKKYPPGGTGGCALKDRGDGK
ncbi:MAG: hypothetical protein JXB23_01780 [Candidatus Aminicenantes bacterium]|nr:hypothetical protein [Candidatus Aminicenantes bacterium]